MARRRRGARAGVEPDSPFELWWLFWAAVILAVVGIFGIALTTPPPTDAGHGVQLAGAALATAIVVFWAVACRLVFWGIGRIASVPLRRLAYVLVPALYLFAREGALGERAAGWCGFELRTGSSDGTTSQHGSIRGGVAPGHAAFVPGCSVIAPAPGARGAYAARGFAAELAPACVPGAAADVQLRYTLEATDAWCYLPLVKWATWPYRVRIDVSGAIAATSVVEGRLEQRSYGLEPCRAFDERLGRAAAAAARAEGDRLVRELRARSALSTRARGARRSARGSR